MSDRHDYYRQYGGQRDHRGGGAAHGAYVMATAIRWIGIIMVTLIVAYVILRITGSIEGIFFAAPGSP